MYRLTEYFGWFNLVPALLVLISLPFMEPPPFHNKGSLASILIMQALVGASIVYSSRQKLKGAEIGHKTYPASIAAYVLSALISYRWFWQGA